MKRYKFGTFQLDLNLKSLRTQDGQPVELTPKAMAVLTYLIENRDRVVSKDELLARLWPGTSVNDSNVHVNISNIREALERHGGKNFIRTVSTQGYHFAESVEECLGGSEPPAAEAAEPLGPVADLGSRPSRRLWVGVSAAAIVLVLMIVGLGINRHWRYVHSPRYFAAMFLTNAIDAHNSGHDQESIELARKAFTADPSLIRAYLLAAWWESLNEVDDRTIQTDAILDQLKAKNAALSQS